MPVPLTLKVFKGETLVTSHDFERDIIKIGRLSSAHLRLDDESVSRVHAVLEAAADGALSIIDMGSAEGTHVNGKRVNKGRVTFGDTIRMGGTTLRLENPAAVSSVVVPAQPAPVAELAPAPVSEPEATVEPLLAPPEKLEVAAALDEVPVSEPAPRVPAESWSHERRPLGVSLRFVWGTQRVGEFFLPPGQKKSFTVGTAAGVDFVMGDSRLGSSRLEVLRTDGETYNVCFTGKMRGELVRRAETRSLEELIESGRATHEDGAYSLALEKEDVFWVDLGAVTLEVCFQPVPKRVHVPLAESVDYRALNIFLVMFFAATMFVISALNRTGGDESFADELTGDQTRLTKLIIKQPEQQKNHFLAKLNEQKVQKQATAQRTPEPKKPVRRSPPITREGSNVIAQAKAQELVQKLFGGKGKGMANLFGPMGKSELRNAIGNVSAMASGVPGGISGLVTKGGPGGPGGPGSTIGLGPLATAGRAGGNKDYGTPTGLTGKQTTDPVIDSSPAEIIGTLDKELVRKVIQDHKQQIRACFESLLNQYPDLSGKVQTQFTIGAAGQVLQSSVLQSTTGSKELDTCVARHVRLWEFPKPKGGGTVVVSYPFIFKQSGR